MNGVNKIIDSLKSNIKSSIVKILFNLYKFLTYKNHSTMEKRFNNYNFKFLEGYENIYLYSAISSFINYQKNKPSILDIGCGTGTLLKKIDINNISFYKGIDISSTAINQAIKLENPKVSFEKTDMMTFEPQVKFNIIIFCESLYYLRDDNQIDIIIEKYDNFLANNGIVIISCYYKTNYSIIFEKYKHHYFLLDDIKVSKNNDKIKWYISIFQKIE